MRFIDANVFIYAALKPKKELPAHIIAMKQSAAAIVKRIQDGEKVMISVVHLGEIANVLEDAAGLKIAIDYCSAILSKPTISVVSVDAKQYNNASILAGSHSISLNDSLALTLMGENQIHEIYTFDRLFTGKGVTVIQQ